MIGKWTKEIWTRHKVRMWRKSEVIDDWERLGLDRSKCVPVCRGGVWVIDMQGVVRDEPIPQKYWPNEEESK